MQSRPSSLAEGERPANGWPKLEYANKAMWRKLGLDTLVWAHMYDDTVYPAGKGIAELRLPYYRSPRIEPEIVFGLKEPLASGGLDAAGVLRSVDWLAIGFEVIDCPYPEWRFKPADFVAAFGLHMALVVGPRLQVHSKMIPALVNDLGSFKVRISKDGQFIEDGFGKNALRSPALCLAELARAVARQSRTSPLVEGELVSTGTLTSGHPITPGETWQVDVDGLPLSSLRLRVMQCCPPNVSECPSWLLSPRYPTKGLSFAVKPHNAPTKSLRRKPSASSLNCRDASR
jgi:2-keto-4-pentenoate hydratase